MNNSVRLNAFLLGSVVFAWVSYRYIDVRLVLILDGYPMPLYLKRAFQVGSLIINPLLYLVAAGGLYLYAFIRRSSYTPIAFMVFFTQCVGAAYVRILKVVIGRSRPYEWVQEGSYGLFGFSWDTAFHSFPSGHTVAVCSLLACLVVNNYRKCWVILCLASICILTRCLLFQHFLSDVILSAAFSYYIAYHLAQGVRCVIARNHINN